MLPYVQVWEGSEPKNFIASNNVPLLPVYDKIKL